MMAVFILVKPSELQWRYVEGSEPKGFERRNYTTRVQEESLTRTRSMAARVRD